MKRRNLTPKLICIFQFKKVFSFSLIYKTQNVFNIVLFLLEIYNVVFENWRRDILGVKHICHQIKQSMQLKECFLIPVGFFSSSFPWKNRFFGTTKFCKILNWNFCFCEAIKIHLVVIKIKLGYEKCTKYKMRETG